MTPTGLAGTYETKVGDGKLAVIGGAFYLPDGGYDLNGQMVSGQVKYSLPVKASQFTVAAGLHYMNGEAGARNLLNRNGARDYLIGVASAQFQRDAMASEHSICTRPSCMLARISSGVAGGAARAR